MKVPMITKNRNKLHFVKILRRNYPETFRASLQEIEQAFQLIDNDIQFGATSKNPMDKRLGFAGWFLALIQVLERQGKSFDEIRRVCLEVAIEYVRPKHKLHSWFKKLPVKLIGTKLGQKIIKIFQQKISQKGHMDGFVANVITDKHETFELGYGIDILECGICKLFKKHNADQYVLILCEVDKITSELAGLELIRTGTLSAGAEKCDFRFRKITSSNLS